MNPEVVGSTPAQECVFRQTNKNVTQAATQFSISFEFEPFPHWKPPASSLHSINFIVRLIEEEKNTF